MKFLTRQTKKIAWLLLYVMIAEMIPGVSYALTSGPSQPEMQGFQPIGNSDMVDLFGGDFSYNIPLMDVGGYPVNMAYHSGSSMDDEASWTGYGWNLNVGSLNRQMRGIPDDFNGTDEQEREMNMKDHITKGGRFSMTVDLLGIPVGKVKKKVKKKKLNLSLTVSVGIKVDNYRGIGMEVGLNPGLSLSEQVAGPNTSEGGNPPDTGSVSNSVGGAGLTLSSQDGATVSLNAAILRKNNVDGDKVHSVSRSVGFGYNSRSGLQGMTLSGSFRTSKWDKGDKGFKTSYENGSSSFISFNSDSYTPTIDHATKSNSYSFSLHLGPEIQIALAGLGVSGFYSRQTISQRVRRSPSYGFYHSEKGKENNDALMDFNREKDIPFSSEVKYLPIPVPTYDLFSASSQDGSGQYHLYRGSSGVFFDQRTETKSSDLSLGIEVGGGTYFDVGADIYKQDIKTITQKWRKRNNFLSKGDFQNQDFDIPYEHAYFKRVGEPVPVDPEYISTIKGTSPTAVFLPSKISNAVEGAEASDRLRTKSNPNGEFINALKRTKREVRNTTLSHLTAKEAANHGLDKVIKDYDPELLEVSNCGSSAVRTTFPREGDYRKGHHFSEVTVTGDDGKRSVYGLPVYNTLQEEVSFSIAENLALRNKGLINYDAYDASVDNYQGRDNYYSKEKMPAYATSHLLTAILSPDYEDVTGNGISDDDLGTAVKFNYSKLNATYKWRTPFAFGGDTANYNEGFLSDRLDDKANYVYGEKEIWYLHSIESKTMVAHFITEDRDDALGVQDNHGGIDSTIRQKRLKEIRLYSKSDLLLNGGDLSKVVPLKVVHFEYDYSLCKGLPNNINTYRGIVANSGKLTLKRIYFTFGQNQKGRLNPYDFEYDESYNFYNYRQYDRWGNFKDASLNPGGLNNSEFPYTLQDTITNHFASAWQLKKIILPSGGSINVTYESDDYGYVQNRRASEMCMVNGVGSQGSATGLINADYIYVNLPYPVSSNTELRERYFEGVQNMYFKFLMDLDNKGHSEFVPGYAELDPNDLPVLAPASNNIAKIRVKKVKNANPMAKAGWQFIRTNLPKYAYPGSDNLEDDGSNLAKAIKALVVAVSSISELIRGFEKRARNKSYSDKINLSKSWVRLCSPQWKKRGGGSRVRRVDISDDWATMSGATGAKTAVYSQVYDYTTKDSKGRTVSTGVASYEPLMGNDENPFRQPIRYKQSQFLALNNYYYIEEPFGESFFPGASVGYSKVTVKTIGSGDEESVNRTGVTVSEFYTSRDYPTKIEVLNLQHRKPIMSKLFKLIGGVSSDVTGVSQGYSIELNDMHGKPRTVNIFNKAGQNISSVEYFYQTVNEKAEQRELRNEVKVIHPDGTVTDGTIGMDVEMFTDMRQETTDNLGLSLKISGGSGAIFIFPLPFFFPGIGINYDRRSFRSSSTVKLINRFAIQYKVKKVENGSSITSENLVWDAETGNILLTKTQNEFDDPIYSFAYPAHWEYERMGQAYRNLGTVISQFSVDPSGIVNPSYNDLLFPGDELIDVNSGSKYWVVNTLKGGTYANRLMDAEGNIHYPANITVKVLRSGRRNIANTAIGNITTLKNPIVNGRLDVTQLSGVLDAKATVFSEEWTMPVYYCMTCPPGYTLSEDGTECYRDTIPVQDSGCYTICAGDNNTAYGWAGAFIFDEGYNLDGTGNVDTVVNQNNFWLGMQCDDLPSPPVERMAMPQSKTSRAPRKRPVVDSSWNKKSSAKSATGNKGSVPKNELTDNGSSNAMRVGPTCNMEPGPRDSSWCGPLNRAGIWSCEGDDGGRLPYGGAPDDNWLGFSVCIDAPTTKTYYLGIASDNYFRFYIDGHLQIQMLDYTTANFDKWFVFPIPLTKGRHYLEFSAKNDGGPAAFAAEVYDNTSLEIAAATDYSDLNMLFTTKDMIGQQFHSSRFTCPAGYSLVTCEDPFVCRQSTYFANKVINPYHTGMLGNWRPKSQYVYQVNRENIVGDPSKFGSTNIRKSGAYSVFNPFWSFNLDNWVQNPENDVRWIAANEMTYFNGKGLEIENKDALNRYSSALFGYLESLPVAVASNSRFREIAYDGFEDYGFLLDCAGSDTCTSPSHFNFRKKLNGSTIDTTSQYSHSGKYSLKLNGSVTLNKSVFINETGALFIPDNHNGTLKLGDNELAKGFSPIPGKKYLLSFWLKDASPRTPSTTTEASVNGNSLVSSVTKWPIVEGWKRVEVPFLLPSADSTFALEIESGGGTVYIDDIRIHPYDGQMKTFAYDPSSQRLMAELDENNFAAFYEYDDEGTLIRVKKETERGIMTIKETRSGYRKR